MRWTSLLGLDALIARWRASVIELAIAVEDRSDLARLEWEQHKRSMQSVVMLLIAMGTLGVVFLLMLSLALLVQFWDSEHRVLVAWSLAGGWLLLWALALWRLLLAARQLSRPFMLTRQELNEDWQALKKRL
ncbi:phage holin family protein [Comamonas composti]|uniref:phage holin family protein n=1 Tax=Comamonas composti TaxID=408558 RepID=UPI0003FCD45C|nr:phage holin family protein [Comamonas composti]